MEEDELETCVGAARPGSIGPRVGVVTSAGTSRSDGEGRCVVAQAATAVCRRTSGLSRVWLDGLETAVLDGSPGGGGPAGRL
jgi:hypothetical protein